MRHHLVVANRTLGGPELLDAIRQRMHGGAAAFWVLVPASRTSHLINDFNALSGAFPVNPELLPGAAALATGGDGIREATVRLETALERLRAIGATADGAIGDPDPCRAIDTVLTDRNFDEIILSTLPPGLSRWLAMDLPSRIRRRTDVPLTVVTTQERVGEEEFAPSPADERPAEESARRAHAEATYERLFGPRDPGAPGPDPELMEILRRFIFGDVFDTGVLDDQIRELITVTVLACLQTLPQLRAHTAAALRVGVPPVAIREALYQLAPFIGFPRTLNAVGTINEVFVEQGIALPLPDQGTVSDSERYARGLAEQAPLYGNEIKDNLADLPEPFGEALPRFLTELCFGDFYTRGGLSLAQRELLVLCALATIGDTAAQLGPHGRACLQVGNSRAVVVAALVHCFPYIGFPRAVAAVRAVKNLP